MDYRGIIPQLIYEYEGYNLDRLEAAVRARGFDVVRMGFDDPRLSEEPRTAETLAVYASSQKPRYAQFLRNHLVALASRGVRLVPALHHALAHDDKALQSLVLAGLPLVQAPRGHVFGYREQAYQYADAVTYPIVWKRPDGYGSSGVKLVRSRAQARRIIDEVLSEPALFEGRTKLRRAIERYFPRLGLGRLLFQDFVPNCAFDWKVLIWGNVACGLKRFNRRNDFRASGSGLFEFAPVPDAVLEFSFQAQRALSLPWASFDVMVQATDTEEKLWLAEYQAVHFGMTTALKGTHFHRRAPNGGWASEPGRIDIEEAMATALAEVGGAC